MFAKAAPVDLPHAQEKPSDSQPAEGFATLFLVQVPPFDPYATLELDASVEGCSRRVTQWGEVKCAPATVRAAYRKLARTYHPDKATGDEAKQRFEDVVKAHAVLTNAQAARNYARYGHPDGYQGFRFGIALPAWAMPKHGKAMDMRGFAACFLVVVVLVPLLFYLGLRDPKGQRRARLAQRAQEVYLLAALGKADDEAGGLERALDMLTDPKGPSPPLHADAVQASRLVALALHALQGEPVAGGARGQLSVEMRAALASLDGASCAEAAAAGEAAGPGPGNTRAPLEYSSTQARTLLLRAYQLREPIAPCLRAELAAVLADVPVILESFFQSAQMLTGLPYRYGAWPVLQVTQQLTQALSRGQPTALQAPHFTVERAALIQAALAGAESGFEGGTHNDSKRSGKREAKGDEVAAAKGGETGGGKGGETGGGGQGGGVGATVGADGEASGGKPLSVWRLVNLAPARRDALLRAAGFGATEAADVCAFVKNVFPRARLDAKVVVQGEESDDEDEGEGEDRGVVLVGDIVTVCLTLTLAPRGNATDKRHDALPLGCHAPRLPQTKPESWAVLVAAEGGGLLLGVRMAPPLQEWTVSAGGARSWTATLSCHADKAGERRLEAHAACSAYHDADVSADVSFEVRAMSRKKERRLAAKAAREAAKAAAAPPGKKKLGQGAGLMRGMMCDDAAGGADDSEDEDEDEDEDPLAGTHMHMCMRMSQCRPRKQKCNLLLAYTLRRRECGGQGGNPQGADGRARGMLPLSMILWYDISESAAGLFTSSCKTLECILRRK